MTFQKGQKHPRGMLGKHHTKEAKKKMSKAKKRGIEFTKEWRLNLSKARKGYKHSEETKRKIGKSGKGRHYHHSEKTKKKLSKNHKGLNTWTKGKNCNFWKGGISFEPYSVDWTRSLRISIRERDKYTCQICGKKQGDYAFDIHHINYDKKNCILNNLITLCRSCHIKTNNNRKYWIKYFNNLIK